VPRVSIIQTNCTAGELSPRLLGRVDVARYANALKTCENAYPLVHGGARRRPGTRYVAEVKNSAKSVRLIPFIFNTSQAFVLEFGDQYIRFYTAGGQVLSGGVPYEISSPYLEAELDDIHFVQSADTMFLAHPSYPMRKLVRYANTNWKLSAISWTVPPSEEKGDKPATTLTLSATTGSVTATAGAAAFQNADVGRYIEISAGRGKITAFTSTTQVTVSVEDAFASVGPHASGAWILTESPKTTLTPSAKDPIGASITLTAGANAFKNDAQVSDIGKFVEINDGLVEITSLDGTTPQTKANGIIRTVLSSTTAAQSGGWALRSNVWNATDGYPRAVTLFEQRLVAAGSTAYPQTIWGSKSGEYYNFADGIADDDGFAFTIASDQVNPIEHLASIRALLPLTYGGEFSMTGGVEKPLTPTNVQLKSQTVFGSAVARPVRVGNEIIFVQRSERKIRSLGYRIDSDSFAAPDLSILSEHITEGGIYEMAYAQEPDQIVWMVRADGVMPVMSIERDQDAIGWSRQLTDGTYESVATIPYNNEDQVWCAVKRKINGSTKRYIEYFQDGRNTDCCILGAVTESAVSAISWAAGTVTVTQAGHGYSTGDKIRLSGFTPSGYNGEYTITVTGANNYTYALSSDPGAATVLGTAAKATTSWSGLSPLEAKTVDIVADGYVATQKTVAAGAITLDKAAYSVEIGLHYKTTIKTLPPEVPTGQGTAQGNALSIHETIVRFYKTKGGTINGQPITTRKFGAGAVLDQPIAEFTGDKRIENLGWGRAGSGDSDGTVTIVKTQPLPMQVLAVIKRLTVNDG